MNESRVLRLFPTVPVNTPPHVAHVYVQKQSTWARGHICKDNDKLPLDWALWWAIYILLNSYSLKSI